MEGTPGRHGRGDTSGLFCHPLLTLQWSWGSVPHTMTASLGAVGPLKTEFEFQTSCALGPGSGKWRMELNVYQIEM